jgi:hypothetical protein
MKLTVKQMKQKMSEYLRKPFAWSYSRVTLYEECPAKYAYKVVYKLKEPPAPELERGTLLHKKGEQYVRFKQAGRETELPPEFAPFRKDLDRLHKHRPIPEAQWVFQQNWSLPMVEWFDERAWLRIQVDLTAMVKPDRRLIVDYKSGRPNEKKHRDQGSLYAVGAFLSTPGLKTAVVEFWYLDQGYPVAYIFTRQAVEQAKGEWNRRAMMLQAESTWSPSPGYWCNWCPFSARKGGPCEY